MHSHDASYGLVMNRILILYFIFNFIDKKRLQCHLPQDRFLKGTARCQSTKSTPSKVNQSYTKRDRRVTNVTKSVHMAKKNFYNFCVTMEQDPGHKKDLA